MAPEETTTTSFFLFRSQTISATTFFKTDLLTPPLEFVNREEPILITNLWLELNVLIAFTKEIIRLLLTLTTKKVVMVPHA
jgi:hypothetical protein